MVYPCGKFGDVVSAVLVLSCLQTHTEPQTHTDATEHFTPATVVGVILYQLVCNDIYLYY